MSKQELKKIFKFIEEKTGKSLNEEISNEQILDNHNYRSKTFKKLWKDPVYRERMTKLSSIRFKGVPKTEEQKSKMRAAKLGKPKTQEHRAAMSKAQKAYHAKRVTCPHCNETVKLIIAKRYHFEKCEMNEN